MKKTLSLLAILSFSSALSAAAIPGPCVTITTNQGSAPQLICGQLNTDGKTFGLTFASPDKPVDIYDEEEVMIAQITGLSLFGDVDPVLGYAISVADFGSPTDFVFAFNTVIVPGSYTHAFSSISGSVTDIGSDGASASPILPAVVMQTASANGGSIDLGVGVGGICTGAAATSTPCPAASLHNFAVAGGPFGDMTLALAFSGSGGGDLIGFNGRLDLDNASVPEPATLALSGAALIGLALLRRRRS